MPRNLTLATTFCKVGNREDRTTPNYCGQSSAASDDCDSRWEAPTLAQQFAGRRRYRVGLHYFRVRDPRAGQYVVACVSARLAAFVDAHRWRLDKHGFPRTTVDGESVYLHRAAYGPVPDGKWVDHADRDRLNCADDNLRAVTPDESIKNRRRPRRAGGYSSRYRGVKLDRRSAHRKRWQAALTAHGRFRYLGLFESEVAAAIAWNRAMRERFPGLYRSIRNFIPVRRTTTTVWARLAERDQTPQRKAA